jgi:hypothetical protein
LRSDNLGCNIVVAMPRSTSRGQICLNSQNQQKRMTIMRWRQL